MNKLLKRLKDVFTKSEDKGKKIVSELYFEGLNAFTDGNLKFINKSYKEALASYDTAILYDVDEAYGRRALCLQTLGFHLDALADFERAIASSPQDCNIYYCRCWSQLAVGNNEESLADIEKAFWLSKSKSIINDTYNESAKAQGYSNMSALIEIQREAVLAIAKLPIPVLAKAENLVRRVKEL